MESLLRLDSNFRVPVHPLQSSNVRFTRLVESNCDEPEATSVQIQPTLGNADADAGK